MKKARDIMTGTLVTCAPEVPVGDAARLMRDRNTGDVLVAQDGKLLGIVTDRDIALRMAAADKDPQAPVREAMTTHIITGQADWNINKIAETMGKHQIRRLPILDDGMLVGIVSLGDLALRDRHEERAGKSLKEISEPSAVHQFRARRHGWFWATLGVGVAAAAMILTRMRLMQPWGRPKFDQSVKI